jgi:hypothetical protein
MLTGARQILRGSARGTDLTAQSRALEAGRRRGRWDASTGRAADLSRGQNVPPCGQEQVLGGSCTRPALPCYRRLCGVNGSVRAPASSNTRYGELSEAWQWAMGRKLCIRAPDNSGSTSVVGHSRRIALDSLAVHFRNAPKPDFGVHGTPTFFPDFATRRGRELDNHAVGVAEITHRLSPMASAPAP